MLLVVLAVLVAAGVVTRLHVDALAAGQHYLHLLFGGGVRRVFALLVVVGAAVDTGGVVGGGRCHVGILVAAASVGCQAVRVFRPAVWRLHGHSPELFCGCVPHRRGVLAGHRTAVIVVGGYHGLPGASVIGDPSLGCVLDQTFGFGFLRLLHRV